MMKVKWTTVEKYGAGNAALASHESDVDWVRLAPGNTMCYAWEEGTRVDVVAYTSLEFLASPGNQIRCHGGTYYESEVEEGDGYWRKQL